MQLDLTPLERAVARLEEGLARFLTDVGDTQIRDGLIQRFEFTYDLATKTLRRAIEASSDIPDQVDKMSFPTVIRTANEQDLLLGTWPDWHGYREMRNITSHTYDEGKALEVVQGIPPFLQEVRVLLQRLQARADM